MANSDKNIVITPAIGSTTADPQIVFSGASSTLGPQNITLKAYPILNGTLSFDGSAGQLFSITNSLTGSIFSVNDVSGIPSIEVLDTGLVKIAQYNGNITLGSTTATSSVDIANGATISGATKTVNIGTGSVGGTTSINIGSSTGTSITTLLGQVNLPRSTFNLTNTSIGMNDGVNVNSINIGSANSVSYSNIIIGSTGFDGDYSTNTYMYGNVVFDPFVNLSFGGATFTSQATFQSTISASGILSLNGDATQNQTFASNQTQGNLQIGGTAQTSGTITIGGSGASSTGTITLGLSPAAQTVNIATGVNTSATKTINIGTGGSSNSVVNLSTDGAIVNYRGSGNFVGTFSIDNVTLNTSIMPTQGSGLITIGGTSSATGTITLGQSTVGQTTNIQAGATASGSTKILNIGTGGLSGSTTTISIGATGGTSTTTLNGAVTAINDTTINGIRVGRGEGNVASNTALGFNTLLSNGSGASNTAVGASAMQNNQSGGSNTVVGHTALINNITGNGNSVLGQAALQGNLTGSNNVAIGVAALQTSLIGTGNIGIGTSALNSSTSSIRTSFLGTITPGTGYVTGTYVGVVMTLASGTPPSVFPTATIVVLGGGVTSVTIINGGSGFRDTSTVLTAPNASIGGAGSGFSVPVTSLLNGVNNIAIGQGALQFSATSTDVIGIGANAARYNNQGRGIYIGNSAGETTYTTYDQVGIGTNALRSSTNAAGQVAIGYNSQASNTSGVAQLVSPPNPSATYPSVSPGSGYQNGTYNDVQMSPVAGSPFPVVGVGGTYPRANITVSGNIVTSCVVSPTFKGTRFWSYETELTVSNTLIGGTGSGFKTRPTGFSSGLSGSFGNTSIGYSTLQNNTYGDSNTAVGWAAMASCVTGFQNTVLGTQSCQNLTTGSNNMSFGRFTMNALTTGNNNTAVGAGALAGITIHSGNTALGFAAGRLTALSATITATENSIYIGTNSRAANATGDNNCIVIGTEAVGLGANTTVIGNSSITQARIFGQVAVGGSTPSGPTATGVTGTITWDANYIYICTSTNAWKRVAISSSGW